MTTAIRIKQLRKSYGTQEVLRGIDLEVPEGQFFGFLGPNGAGKTTTIHSMTGVANYDSGSIRIFDHEVKDEHRLSSAYIGLSPQEFNVDIFAPVRLILDLVGGYFGMSGSARASRIDALLEKFHLTKYAESEFRALSGGYKRRVMLARALMHDPAVLILDEPTAGVDVELRRELWQYLQDLNSEGKTILLTSHYLEEVEHLCERVAILHEGTIAVDSDKDALLVGGKRLEEIYLDITGKHSPERIT